MRRAGLFTLTLLVAVPVAHAGAGDYKEDALREQVKEVIEFSCPRGARRTVTGSKGSMVETCVTSEGVRNGYFLKWAADGSTWLQIGSYADGRKDGKWIKFTKDGDPKKVTWFAQGRKTRSKRRPAQAKN